MLQLSQQQPLQPPSLPPPPVTELWKVHADVSHGLLAAGAKPTGPCATLSLDHPQRVIIWWPSLNPKTQQHTVSAEVIRHPVRVTSMQWSPDLHDGGSFAGALSSINPHQEPSSSSSSSNQQNSKGSGSSSNTSPTKAAAAGAVATAKQACHPALMTVGIDGVVRIYVEVVLADLTSGLPTPPPPSTPGPSTSTSSSSKSPPKHPTSPLKPKDATPVPPAAAAAGPSQTLSQFCLTLVIEPPLLGLNPGSWPGMTASWVRPMHHHHHHLHVSSGGAGSGLTSSSRGAARTGGSGGGSGPAANEGTNNSSSSRGSLETRAAAAAAAVGGPEAAAAAAAAASDSDDEGEGGVLPQRVLWLVGSYIAPGGNPALQLTRQNLNPNHPHPQQQQLSGSPNQLTSFSSSTSSSSAGGVGYQDHVFLWAIDGLSGVVLSGLAQNAIMASKLNTPKAVLWGRSQGQLLWQQPHLLLKGGPGQQGVLAAGAGAGALAAAVGGGGGRGGGGEGMGGPSLGVWGWQGRGRPVPLLCGAQQFYESTSR